MPATLDDHFPADRTLAETYAELRCPSIAGDHDRDGRTDVVALAVAPGTRRSALILVRADGAPRILVQLPAPKEGPGAIDRPITEKPAGERVLREHLEDRERLAAPAAVEMCRALEGQPLTTHDLCYRSTWCWIAGGEVQTAGACD